ncbi:MAG: alpha/beta fold hydrolase [Stellaceae bacterium]
MPTFSRGGIDIYYEEFGAGYPVLIFAPGGLRSAISWWHPQPDGTQRPWIDPTVALAGKYRVIAMDQRNAGQSRAPIKPGDGWQSYASDHLALMDHLGHRKFHTMGGCIGSSFCLSLCEMVPDRISAAVLQNPIGFDNNRDIFKNAAWSEAMLTRDQNLDQATIDGFFEKMFGGDFTFNTTRDFVKQCRTPLLVMPGDDPPHPKVIGEEIAATAPNAEVLRDWKGADKAASVTKIVLDFLTRHTPAR